MEKSKRIKRQFTSEFKSEAIKLADRVGNTQAARDLEISESQIRYWRNKVSVSNDPKPDKTYSDLEKENRRLQKEIGYLKEINKVLKKSTAIFSANLMDDLK